MKKTNFKFFYVLFCTLISANVVAQTEFITTWKTDNAGTSGTTEITIPTNGTGYNYDVDWDNDGTFDEFGLTGDVTHDFGTAGTYTIRIQGDFPRIYFNSGGDCLKFLDVSQWGNIAWSNMRAAFFGCDNMNFTASDTPDLSSVSSFFRTFKFCSNFNTNIDNWNMSTVTNFEEMFWGCSVFNQPLNSWVTTNVTSTFLMFYLCSDFNQPLDNWDLSNAQSLYGMFWSSKDFNQDISGWNTSSVQNMARTFNDADDFEQNIGAWDVSNVTNASNMFNYMTLSTENYDSILIGWAAQSLQTGVVFHGGNAKYCQGDSARYHMINSMGWTIDDNGQDCGDIDFVTTWQTDNTGTSGSTEITIPTSGSGYDYDVDWDNDGTYDTLGVTGDITHDFGAAGTYTIRIKGDFPRIRFNNGGDREKILDVSQWGAIQWTNFNKAFYGCSNLDISALDVPDLSGVTNLGDCFWNCSSLTTGLSNWDVSTIQNFSGMLDSTPFNEDLSGWITSSATTIKWMFFNSEFNLDISMWDVSGVTTMFEAFGASKFNQNLNTWDVSSVTNMEYMFRDSDFNGDISSWVVDSVTTMRNMFSGASDFNQDISGWNMNGVTKTHYMFRNSGFNQDISSWDMSTVQNMRNMFQGSDFDQNLGAWDMSAATNVTEMFNNMALSTANYDSTLIEWSSQVLTAGLNFDGGNSNYCISDQERASIVSTYAWTIVDAGQNCDSTEFITIWQTDNIGTSGTTEITIPTTGSGYNYDVDWDNDGTYDEFGITGDVTHDFGVAGTYTIRIKGDFPRIYFNNSGDRLKLLSVDQWGTIAWTNMNAAFRGCENLNINATDAPDLSLCSNMYYMLAGCTSMNEDISSWDVSTISNFGALFSGCTSFNQPLSAWDLSDATSTWGMFYATPFNQDISGWNMSNVTETAWMFHSASDFDQDISGWSVGSVTDMDEMFNGATSFDQNIGSWEIDSVLTAADMFNNVTLSTDNYDSLLIGWAAQNLYPGVVFSGGNSLYCAGDSARYHMTNTMGWTITDGGQDCVGDEFITIWKTDNSGTSGTTEITIPTNGTGYNYEVDWDNDGTYDEFGIAGDVTHDFGVAGTYTIRIKGEFPRIYFNDGGDKSKLLDVTDWGSNVWSSFSRAFWGCGNMVISATDAPDLSSATAMDRALRECDNLLGTNLASWNVSTITNFHRTFESADIFNANLDSWNVGSGTNFSRMFINCDAYDQPMNNWDVSNGISFHYMFNQCNSLNQDLDNWNTLNATNMNNMFNGCDDFNGNITTWATDSVTNFSSMFSGCPDFNQNLGAWNVSSATDIGSMFNNATSFDQDLSSWDVSGVTNAGSMFNNVTLSTSNYDNLLIGWNAQSLQSGVSFDGGNSLYCAGEYARTEMISIDFWVITDGGPDDSTPPVADLASLSDVTAECEITSLTEPTATDNCASVVTATNDAVLPISTLGITVVTWTYDDGHGNTSTQTQNVVIFDTTSPTASNPVSLNVQCVGDIPTPSPSFVTDEIDNCSGTVTVAFVSDLSDGLSCPETITRTFSVTDAAGNSINVEQSIIIQDVTAPVADNSSLTNEEGFCDITLTAPTATDNCSGIIMATADVTFPINTLGTTTVTWTYSDDCGNTSTQTQDVIINSIDVSTSMASDNITIVSNNSNTGVTYQWIDCLSGQEIVGETNHNYTPTYGSEFAVIITEDGCSETSDCVNSTVSVDELSFVQILIYPNPSSGSFTIQSDQELIGIDVIDMLGRTVMVDVDLQTGIVNGSMLTNGNYFIQITTTNLILTKEILIQE